MSRTVVVNPVTRIEGHAKVHVTLGDDGHVEDARLQVLEFRGFERFVRGVQVEMMPTLLTRICGTCPHAHHLAAAKCLDRVFDVTPPRAAVLQRKLLNYGSFIHSHAIHFFILSGPDFFLANDTLPAKRSVVGLLEVAPELGKAALKLRTLGQRIAQLVGGRGTHPVTAIAGGMTSALRLPQRDTLRALTGEALALSRECVLGGKAALHQVADRLSLYPTPAYDLATIGEGGALELYDGVLRLRDPDGALVLDYPAENYAQMLVEETFTHTYAKQVRTKLPGGAIIQHRVGPLARINCADHIDTELANKELEELRARWGRPCHLPVVGHLARLIELLHCAEAAARLVEDDALFDAHVHEKVSKAPRNGIAHVEAPRGVLLHDFTVSAAGLIEKANLLVATQHNLPCIDETIRLAAESSASAGDAELLDAVEFAIRCYDPCLSCSTHQVGNMPLSVSFTRGGKVVREARRPS